jgi:hypothetical protein
MTIVSAISIIPLLIPCNSSAPFTITKKSTILCTAVSLCPTPTVSMMIVSKPQASQSNCFPCFSGYTTVYLQKQRDECMRFRLWLTRPCGFYLPKYFRAMVLLGSTARTATFFNPVKCFPNASMNVLFQRLEHRLFLFEDLFAWGKQALITAFALTKWVVFVLSTKVIARLKAVILPNKIAWTSSSEEGCIFCIFECFLQQTG